MNRRVKFKIILLIWLVLFFILGFGAWSFQAGQLMLLGYFILSVIIYIVYAFLARCPECRLPILLRPLRIFGMELYIWSIVPPEHCRHCNAILSQRRTIP